MEEVARTKITPSTNRPLLLHGAHMFGIDVLAYGERLGVEHGGWSEKEAKDKCVEQIIANAAIALPGATLDETTTETGLTMAQGEELRRRWGAMASALATTGESNAAKQSALNETSRRNAITEIAGRAKIGAKEFESLKSVAPERRIAEVLLTIPRGAERAAAVEDALTPPADGEDLGGDEENEDVFTTAPRLLNVLEGMARERRTDGEDDSELCELIEIVERKCDV